MAKTETQQGVRFDVKDTFGFGTSDVILGCFACEATTVTHPKNLREMITDVATATGEGVIVVTTTEINFDVNRVAEDLAGLMEEGAEIEGMLCFGGLHNYGPDSSRILDVGRQLNIRTCFAQKPKNLGGYKREQNWAMSTPLKGIHGKFGSLARVSDLSRITLATLD